MASETCLSPEDCLAHLEKRQPSRGSDDLLGHLDSCHRCQAMMSEAARALIEEGRPGPRVLATGDRLAGRFDIVRFVARGGMGEVYEAFDSVLQERVALKTLSLTTLDDAASAERLLAEVRLARRVTHPNVCRILELGLHDRKGELIPFLTMEFLAGETLAQRLRRVGQLSSSEAKVIIGQLVAGLAAIHRAGIVHRDFKSENVMLVADEQGAERAVVMDFGLARALAMPLSSARAAVGTPHYMAPEQLEGKPVTPAVDVYALGVVVFEMLTGRLPFADRLGLAAAWSRVHAPAPLPSSVIAGLPAAWDDVVGRCLERAPERRWSSVDQVTERLSRDEGGRRGPKVPRMTVVLALGLITVVVGVLAWRGREHPAPVPATVTAGRKPAEVPGAVVSDPRAQPEQLPPARPPVRESRRDEPRRGRRVAPVATRAAPENVPVAPAPTVTEAAAPPLDPPLLTPPSSRPRHPDDVVRPF